MTLLANIVSDESIADEKDAGAGGGGLLDTAIYPAVIKIAYTTQSKSGAIGIVVHAEADKRLVRETLWVASSTAKGNKNYYEKDGEKHYLPGYLTANALALLTTGKEIARLETEQKVVAVYNHDVKAEVPTKVDMLVELLDKEVFLGITRERVNKRVKDENGIYTESNDTKDQNTVSKVFRASDKKTTFEIRHQRESTEYEAWSKRWTGEVRNRAKVIEGVAAAPKAASANRPAASRPTVSLFA